MAQGIRQTSYLPENENGPSAGGGWNRAFRANTLQVLMDDEAAAARSARFGLTNCEFIGTQPEEVGAGSHLILPLALRSLTATTDVLLRPVDQYRRVMNRVRTLDGIDVTAEAAAGVAGEGDVNRLTEVVDDLCYLLSLARGTKVQWVYYDLCRDGGGRLSRTHHARVTKAYCPLPLIDPRADAREHTKNFLEVTYREFAARSTRYKLKRGAIDAYLDAKSESDYLEMRAVKLAVVMELVKAVLRTAEGLKEKHFGALVAELCGTLGVKAEEREINLFVACRNSLVHQGDFYLRTATLKQRAKVPPFLTPAEEYFFLLNFLDRFFLRLVGYSGPYLDWRLPRKGDVPTGHL
jgi:hypothetical protein